MDVRWNEASKSAEEEGDRLEERAREGPRHSKWVTEIDIRITFCYWSFQLKLFVVHVIE